VGDRSLCIEWSGVSLLLTTAFASRYDPKFELRQSCRQIGHPLSSKIHDGDRWIIAAAIRRGLPLVSHDGVFKSAPRLVLLTAGPDA
jgi:predicted nucleic acid-binding protein